MSTYLHRPNGRVKIHLPRRTVLMVGGIPGSGKSSFIDNAIAPGVEIISADECRGVIQEAAGISKDAYDRECIPLARKLFLDRLYAALAADKSIVVDAAYLSQHSRDEIGAWALAAEYNSAAVFIRATLKEIYEGNKARKRVVDPESMSKFVQDWEKLYHAGQLPLVNGLHCFNVILNRDNAGEAEIDFDWNGGAYLELHTPTHGWTFLA